MFGVILTSTVTLIAGGVIGLITSFDIKNSEAYDTRNNCFCYNSNHIKEAMQATIASLLCFVSLDQIISLFL